MANTKKQNNSNNSSKVSKAASKAVSGNSSKVSKAVSNVNTKVASNANTKVASNANTKVVSKGSPKGVSKKQPKKPPVQSPAGWRDCVTDTSVEITPDVAVNILKAERIIGYKFKDKCKIAAALTHPSFDNCKNYLHSYERLEYLGDAILGAVVASESYRLYPKLTEGGLTRIKIALVAGETLSEVAQQIKLAACVLMGDLPEPDRLRGQESVAEDVYEAVIGALFLDGGWSAASKFILSTVGKLFDVQLAYKPNNAKSELQEVVQRYGIMPVYNVSGVDGPPHSRIFSSEVLLGDEIIGSGEGSSKKAAETLAAEQALERSDLKKIAKRALRTMPQQDFAASDQQQFVNNHRQENCY